MATRVSGAYSDSFYTSHQESLYKLALLGRCAVAYLEFDFNIVELALCPLNSCLSVGPEVCRSIGNESKAHFSAATFLSATIKEASQNDDWNEPEEGEAKLFTHKVFSVWTQNL